MKPKKEWKNMEKTEYDKLEWMKDLPPPSTDNKEVQITLKTILKKICDLRASSEIC